MRENYFKTINKERVPIEKVMEIWSEKPKTDAILGGIKEGNFNIRNFDFTGRKEELQQQGIERLEDEDQVTHGGYFYIHVQDPCSWLQSLDLSTRIDEIKDLYHVGKNLENELRKFDNEY